MFTQPLSAMVCGGGGNRKRPFPQLPDSHQITSQLVGFYKFPVFIWFCLFVYVFVCFDFSLAQIWHKGLHRIVTKL